MSAKPVTEGGSEVSCVEDLEQVVGSVPLGARLKSISFLDEHCAAMLACSPFLILGARDRDGRLRSVPLGGAPGTAAPVERHSLALPHLDDPTLEDGAPAATLVLVPGYGETLRVNGRLRLDPIPRVEVEEAFLHCAKAVIRSRLWDEPAAPTASADVNGRDEASAFLGRAPFVTLSSVDAGGAADVSPKGDPPAVAVLLDERRVAIADRPGNRRTDTLHNLMSRPELSLLALVPGDARVLEISGRATVSTERSLLEAMAVRDKTPKAAVVVDVERMDLRDAPAIDAARLWDTTRHIAKDALPRASKIWVDHVRHNEQPGVGAKVARSVVSERLLAKGIEHDYRKNLY